jgi:hypothetical protein
MLVGTLDPTTGQLLGSSNVPSSNCFTPSLTLDGILVVMCEQGVYG